MANSILIIAMLPEGYKSLTEQSEGFMVSNNNKINNKGQMAHGAAFGLSIVSMSASLSMF